MKYTFFIALFILSSLLTGCQSVPAPETAREASMSETAYSPESYKAISKDGYLYENDIFSLNFPSEYSFDSLISSFFISPKNPDIFPVIEIRGASDSNREVSDIKKALEQQNIELSNRCSANEECGKIEKWESDEIKGKAFLKMKINENGQVRYYFVFPTIETKNGPILLKFITSSQGTMVSFDDIIKTIQFKEQ